MVWRRKYTIVPYKLGGVQLFLMDKVKFYDSCAKKSKNQVVGPKVDSLCNIYTNVSVKRGIIQGISVQYKGHV